MSFSELFCRKSKSNCYTCIRQRKCVTMTMCQTEQHYHEIWWGKMVLRDKVDYEETMSWRNNKKKESCWEAKFYSYCMQILSLFKEGELKESLSPQKEGGKVVVVSFILTCGGGLVTKSCLTLATPWTVASQAPLPTGFSRQEYWGGLPFPSPRSGFYHAQNEFLSILCYLWKVWDF